MSLKMGLLGRKIGMTRVFHESGMAIGCTVLELGPNVIVAKRTLDKHGYAAIQLGFEELPLRLVSRPRAGIFKKAGVEKPLRFLREVRLEAAELDKYEVGKSVRAADVFKTGDVVDAIGVTKGKGYQGVMKRHGMAGDTATHGTHEFFRHGGSIGCRLTPGRVHKGKRMSGRMGCNNYTSSDLVVVKVIDDKNVVLVKGTVPGPAGGLILLKGSVKDVAKYVVPLAQKEIEAKNPRRTSKAASLVSS